MLTSTSHMRAEDHVKSLIGNVLRAWRFRKRVLIFTILLLYPNGYMLHFVLNECEYPFEARL